MKNKQLIKSLEKIYRDILAQERLINELAIGVHKQYRQSAKNLCHYMILRRYDLRKYHDHLSDLGISSLRTSEGYVLSNLTKVLKLLKMISHKKWVTPTSKDMISYKKSEQLLRKHANELFNETQKRHFTEIIVTLPSEAADNIGLIKKLA